MPTPKLTILRKPLKDLQPAPYNPRKALAPKDSRYRKLKRSLEQFGLVEPLVWNRRTGYVVGGHQRLRILKELGWKEVPVAVVDLPEAEEKALNVVLNNREAQSDWDVERLRGLLDELAAEPTDLRATGFDPSHLDQLRMELAPAPDAVQQEPEPTVCEVTLIIPQAEYEKTRPALDQLLGETGLECHVRWR